MIEKHTRIMIGLVTALADIIVEIKFPVCLS
jgi:hypothetical protein